MAELGSERPRDPPPKPQHECVKLGCKPRTRAAMLCRTCDAELYVEDQRHNLALNAFMLKIWAIIRYPAEHTNIESRLYNDKREKGEMLWGTEGQSRGAMRWSQNGMSHPQGAPMSLYSLVWPFQKRLIRAWWHKTEKSWQSLNRPIFLKHT